MQKSRKDKHFIKNPIYEGGLKALRTFVSQHKKYPEQALEKKIEGTVYLKYEIDFKGNVTGVKVIRSLGNGCDEEAVRVVKLLKFKVPKNRGVKVKFHKNIQIHFRLPKEKPKPTGTQITYSMTPAKKKEKVKSKKEGKSYSIQIKF